MHNKAKYLVTSSQIMLFIMPLLALYAHSAVTVMLVLGLVFYIASRKQDGYQAETSHRVYLISAAAVLVIAIISLLINGLNKMGQSELERYLRLLFAYPLLIIFIKSRVNMKWLEFGVLLLGWVLLVLIPLEFATNNDIWRLSAFDTLNSIRYGDVAAVLMLIAAIACTKYLHQRRYLLLFIGLVALAGTTAAVFLSGTRATLLVLPIYFVLLVALFICKKMFKELLVVAIIAVPISLASWHFDVAKIKTHVVRTVEIIADGQHDHSRLARALMWQFCWDGFLQKPILGNGTGSFEKNFNDFQKPIYNYPAYNQAHNDYFNTLYARGILGFLALMAVMLVPLWAAFKMLRAQKYYVGTALMGTVLGYAVFAVTESVFTINSMIEFYSFMVAALWAFGCKQNPQGSQ